MLRARFGNIVSLVLHACILMLSCAVFADAVHLKSGEVKEGKVVSQTDKEVVLEVQIGRMKAKLRIPTNEIDKIVKAKVPLEQFEESFNQISSSDAQGYFKLGEWAESKGLTEEAQKAYQKSLAINPDHSEAARKLGLVRIEGEWKAPKRTVAEAEALYKTGKYEKAIAALEQLRDIPKERMDSVTRKRACWLLGLSYQATSQWDKAAETYDLFPTTTQVRSEVAEAIARRDILRAHPDGMFLCDKGSLPRSLVDLFEEKGESMPTGLQPLSDERVMQLAIRAEACKILDSVKKKMEEAEKKAKTDPEIGEKEYRLAASLAERAEDLLPGIARAVSVEIMRRRKALFDARAAELHDDLAKVFIVSSNKMFTGKIPQAEESLRIANRLERWYGEMLEIIEPFSEELHKEVEHLKKQSISIKDQQTYLKDQIEIMKIRKKIEDLNTTVASYAEKGYAEDPGRFTYRVNMLTGEFSDGGREWKRHVDNCVACMDKAISGLKEIVRLCQKRPDVFAQTMAKAKELATEYYGFRQRVALLRDQQGLAR